MEEKNIPCSKLVSILENRDGYVIFDKALQVVYFNYPAQEYFSMKFGEICNEIGKSA